MLPPQVESNLRSVFFNAFSAPYTGSNVDWLTQNAKVDGNDFSITDCTWLKEAFEAVENPDIDLLILQGAAGTFKTTFQDLCDAWLIAENPGKLLRVFPGDDMARDFTKTRLVPILESCPPVAALCDKGKVRTSHGLVLFPHMEIKSSGPSEKIQYGWSANFLQIDEAHLLTVPIENFFKRVRKNYANRKIIITSTCGEQIFDKDGKLIGDQLSKLVSETTVKRRAWNCPHCNQFNVWRWSHKRAEEKESYSGINYGEPVFKSDGSINQTATAVNAKLECHHCRVKLDDKSTVRKSLEQSAIYQTIHEGNPRWLTLQWPAWVAPFHSFSDSVLEYLKAKELADSRQYDKLKNFYKQIASEEWSNKVEKVRSKLTFQRFDSLGEWAEEKWRFMEIDVQGNSLWYWMIVAFDAVGHARIIRYGEAHSWSQLEEIAITYKVMLPNGERAHHVGVDGNFQTGEVAKQTVLRGIDEITTDSNGNQWKEHFGWLMLRGDDRKRFTNWHDHIERAIGPQEWYSEGFAEGMPPARQHWWSNPSIKNLVASIRDGHNKLKLVVNTTDENLTRQLYSEYPDEFGNWKQKSADNHWWDTLCMAYAHALLAGIPFLGEDEKVPT